MNLPTEFMVHVAQLLERLGIRLTPYKPDFAQTMEAAESFMRRYKNALRDLAK